MQVLVDWGVNFIRAVQELQHPITDFFFGAFTFLGQETFFLLFLPWVWIALGWQSGARVSALLVISTLINIWIKDWVQLPRPFETFPDVFVYEPDGYSFPSGHAQVGLTFWFSIGAELANRRINRWLPGVVILIGLSRVYFGVHYPTDVLAGWLVGVLLVTLYYRWLHTAKNQLKSWPPVVHLTTAVLIPGLLAFVHPSDLALAICGASGGLGIGMVLCHHRLGYEPHPKKLQKLYAYLASVLGTAILYFGLERLLPEDVVWIYVRYLFIGAWISGGALWLAQKFSLSEHSNMPKFES